MLVIEGTCMRTDVLKHLLQACPRLETFKFKIIRGSELVPCTKYIGEPAVNQALSQVGSTLRRLEISDRFTHKKLSKRSRRETRNLLGEHKTISSLKDFSLLSHLEIVHALLLGPDPEVAPKWRDVLPDTLQTLTLTDASHSWSINKCAINVAENLRKKNIKPPALRRFRIKIDWWPDSGGPEILRNS